MYYEELREPVREALDSRRATDRSWLSPGRWHRRRRKAPSGQRRSLLKKEHQKQNDHNHRIILLPILDLVIIVIYLIAKYMYIYISACIFMQNR